ncbi:MAG TPA: HAD-IA family hydrolase [Candidatus Limnocylindria bacterium]|jgi:beta-phosphoglucomutase family hydrolase|nr:HAD-IA family hydrolase [Candidatus Limnocylindria bacterium]
MEESHFQSGQRPHALIFDCDGTLADTMPLHWQAWQLITRKYRIEFPEDRFYSLGGVPTRDILRMLAGEQRRPDLDPLMAAKEKEEAYLKLLPQVGPVKEVVAIASEHRGRLPMAVASGGSERSIGRVLNHLGIHDWFQAVVTNEAVQRQKPAPDIFLEAARRLGVAPRFCRAYEDTDLGMQAIRSAGMDAVDVRLLRGMPLRG